VWSGAAAVGEDVLVVAAGVEQSVGQDGHTVEGSLLVDALRDLRDGSIVPVEPSRINLRWTERLNNVTQ
jgi:hypothetical protein